MLEQTDDLGLSPEFADPSDEMLILINSKLNDTHVTHGGLRIMRFWFDGKVGMVRPDSRPLLLDYSPEILKSAKRQLNLYHIPDAEAASLINWRRVV